MPGFLSPFRSFCLLAAVFYFSAVSPAFTAESSATPAPAAAAPAQASAADEASLDFANGLYARKMYGPASDEYRKFIADFPSSPDIASARFRLADSSFFLKKYDEAITEFGVFIQAFPQDSRTPLALFRTGISYYQKNNYTEAGKIFFRVTRAQADANVHSGAFYYLAKIHQSGGRLDKAIFVYKRLIQNYPQTDYAAFASMALGDIFVSQKQDEEAINAYQFSAQRPMPQNVSREAALKLADLYFLKERYQESKKEYERLLDSEFSSEVKTISAEKKKHRSRILRGLFYSYFHLKDFQSALKTSEKAEAWMREDDNRFENYFVVAALAADQKKYDDSLLFLEKIIKDASSPAEWIEKTVFKKSSVLNLMGKADEALLELNKVIEGSSSDMPRAYFQRAEILRGQGKLEEALVAYEAVVKAPKTEFKKDALYEMGFIYVKKSQPEEARKAFSLFLSEFPQAGEADKVFLQKMQIDLDQELFDAVIAQGKIFFEKYPDSILADVAHYKMGMAYAGKKDFQRSADSFRKVSKENPSSPLLAESLYGEAVSLESAGNFKMAASIYENISIKHEKHALAVESLLRLGALYVQMRAYEKAASFYEHLLLTRRDIDLKPDVSFWVIRYYLDHSKYDRMKPILENLSERHPREDFSHEINFFLGESSMGMKQYEEAIKNYSKSIELKPEGLYAAHAHLGIGLALASLGRLDEAQLSLARAIGFDMETEVVLRGRFEIANLKLKSGKTEEAAKAFMHVAILFDDAKYCSAALFKAGECYSKLGRADEALKIFSELIERYPQTHWAKRAESFLKQFSKKR